MRVAAFVHFAMPYRNAGSEVFLHRILKEHSLAGDHVQCVTTDNRAYGPGETYDEVPTVNATSAADAAGRIAEFGPDVVYTHHHNATHSIRQSQREGRVSVMIVHSDMTANKQALRAGPDLIVYNSDWVAANYAPTYQATSDQMVVHPPLDCDRHRVGHDGSGAVTLVNLNEHKGSRIFYSLAARMPDVEFVGVIGGHGNQIVRRDLPNVRIVDHAPDMRPVWQQTSIVLMPSVYESYGLVGVEAACSGIPTIANPTPGLRESLNYAGVFVDRDDIDGWESAIRNTLGRRESHSTEARRRAIELCDLATTELAHLREVVAGLVARV